MHSRCRPWASRGVPRTRKELPWQQRLRDVEKALSERNHSWREFGGWLSDWCACTIQWKGPPRQEPYLPQTTSIPPLPPSHTLQAVHSSPASSLHSSTPPHPQCWCIGIVMAWKLRKNQPCSQGCGPDHGCRPVSPVRLQDRKKCSARFRTLTCMHFLTVAKHAVFPGTILSITLSSLTS